MHVKEAEPSDISWAVRERDRYQAYLNACVILLAMNAPLKANNPYRRSLTQGGFITFGSSHVLDCVARVANAALKVGWCHKWLVHRRVRPEAFSGRVHNHLTGAAQYPIHADLLNAAALGAVFRATGSYLLPMAYPEGGPTHPAYPAGHAAIAGACAIMLKAFFTEAFVIPEPVVASLDGFSLAPYKGPALTVGGELNKLASNIALGRDTAGVHWHSDGIEGLKLGEAVAIGILTDLRATYHEDFGGFSFTNNWPDFHQRVLKAALDSRSELLSAQDASFIPKSGKQTFGLGHFFNGCANRAEGGPLLV